MLVCYHYIREKVRPVPHNSDWGCPLSAHLHASILIVHVPSPQSGDYNTDHIRRELCAIPTETN